MKHWKDDSELFSIARKELFTALVGDSLEQLVVYPSGLAFCPPWREDRQRDVMAVQAASRRLGLTGCGVCSSCAKSEIRYSSTIQR